MSKRSNPFASDLCRQMKQRISQKEYNETHEKNMKFVHEKTMLKLFNGSKQFYEPNGNYTLNSVISHPAVDNRYNTRISEYCSLCNELNIVEIKCVFCDKLVCSTCGVPCIKCHENFCVNHSLKTHSRTNNCLCLNCIGDE